MPSMWELPGREMDPEGKLAFPSCSLQSKSAVFMNVCDISRPVFEVILQIEIFVVEFQHGFINRKKQ